MMRVNWPDLRLNVMADTEATQWKKRFERERAARKSAEKLLEDKSLEIWMINQDLEKKILERTSELQDALVAAEGANKAKDAFLSNMSHELRTPLNAIIGFSQILMAKSDTPETIKGFIEKIHLSGKNLLTLVNTILDFSKIESGKMDVVIAPFDMQDLIDEVKILVEPMATKNEITLDLDLAESLNIEADRQLIKQVLVNLLSNGIKFSPKSSSIVLEDSEDEKFHIFAIHDQGAGIPQKDIATLFDPFTQIREHQNESIKGTGLGLAIVKRIIELHHGKIWVESIQGQGSSFYIGLPKNGLGSEIKSKEIEDEKPTNSME